MFREFDTRTGEPVRQASAAPDFDPRALDAGPVERPKRRHPHYHPNPGAAGLYRSIDNRTADRMSTAWLATGLVILAAILGGLFLWYMFAAADNVAEIVGPI